MTNHSPKVIFYLLWIVFLYRSDLFAVLSGEPLTCHDLHVLCNKVTTDSSETFCWFTRWYCLPGLQLGLEYPDFGYPGIREDFCYSIPTYFSDRYPNNKMICCQRFFFIWVIHFFSFNCVRCYLFWDTLQTRSLSQYSEIFWKSSDNAKGAFVRWLQWSS